MAHGRAADRLGRPARDGDDLPALPREGFERGFADKTGSSGDQNSWHVVLSGGTRFDVTASAFRIANWARMATGDGGILFW
jgi:hypothetical protein